MGILKLKIDKDLIVYEEENEILLIHMKKNVFYALDTFSSFIWRNIEEFKELNKVVEEIVNVTGVDKKVAMTDIKQFIFKLKDAEVINIV